MRLEFSGIEEVAEGADLVWARLMDHRVVASCAPGTESVEAIDDEHFKVVAAFGVGSVKLRFVMNVELSDLQPPSHARMSVRGHAPGSALNAESSISLEPLGPKSTRLSWTIASDLHGTVANVGGRLLAGTAKRLVAGFWKTFAKRVVKPAGKATKPRALAKRKQAKH